jgi:hypothetical protein
VKVKKSDRNSKKKSLHVKLNRLDLEKTKYSPAQTALRRRTSLHSDPKSDTQQEDSDVEAHYCHASKPQILTPTLHDQFEVMDDISK